MWRCRASPWPDRGAVIEVQPSMCGLSVAIGDMEQEEE